MNPGVFYCVFSVSNHLFSVATVRYNSQDDFDALEVNLSSVYAVFGLLWAKEKPR